MARKKTASAEVSTESPATDRPDVFDEAIAARHENGGVVQELVAEIADRTRIDQDQPSHTDQHPRQFATGHIANHPTSRRRDSHAASVRKLPSTRTHLAGELKVQLIDKGDNAAGIGIKIDLPEGRSLSDEEKQAIRDIVRGDDNNRSGFNWQSQMGMWHKHIVQPGEDPSRIPPSRPVAIRLDAESRAEKLADALKDLQADPAGYADRIRQEREQAPAGRIPD